MVPMPEVTPVPIAFSCLNTLFSEIEEKTEENFRFYLLHEISSSCSPVYCSSSKTVDLYFYKNGKRGKEYIFHLFDLLKDFESNPNEFMNSWEEKVKCVKIA